MRNRLKLLLIFAYVLCGGAEIWRRLDMVTTPEIQPAGLIAYCILFAMCTASLVGAAYINRGWIRWSLAAIFAVSSVTVDSYQWAVGDFMEYDGFVTMMQSAGDLGNAFAQQSQAMLMALGKGLLLFFGIGPKSVVSSNLLVRMTRLVSLPILALLTVLLFFRGGEGGSGLPTSHSGASFALLFGYEYLTNDHGPREVVSIEPSRENSDQDIVLVIDESIAGAYLDINSDTGVYSGLLKQQGDVPIHNFGLAASITHCSVGSNVVLRFGGTRDNYREVIRNKPSIWSYAKTAGFETIYIDAQRTGGQYQNLMDDAERAEIDQWHQFEDVAVLHRDHAVADRLSGYLNDGTKQFILVNKVGAHFPVNDKFPDSHAQYRPMLKRGTMADVTDTATRDHLDGRQSNWILYRNSYRNSLTWNVGGFFDRLFERANLDSATIIYTSDHGQTFHERGEKGKATHCTPSPEIEEGLAPLVVIGDQKNQERWASAVKQSKDGLSHYRIFPTLLQAMGYAEKAVKPVYGPDMLAPDPDPFTFNVKFNARLGGKPVWKHIPLDQVAHPPESDYSKKN
ncbi:MAG: sulfatase-like hydrolase/transferase [Parasphingorhabdus sp.]